METLKVEPCLNLRDNPRVKALLRNETAGVGSAYREAVGERPQCLVAEFPLDIGARAEEIAIYESQEI